MVEEAKLDKDAIEDLFED